MSSITTLLETMRMLRDKDNGCPWDIEQTLESLSPCVVEEAYEVSDAIANKDYENLKEELGDVLLQVIFQAEIANESELFDFDEVVDSLNKNTIDFLNWFTSIEYQFSSLVKRSSKVFVIP